MSLKERFAFLANLREENRLAREEKQRIQDAKELEDYHKRQEKYNDMLRDEALKQKFLTNMDKIKINTYTKRMVAIIIGFAIVGISASYILAFLDKGNSLENLSNQLCITILGVAFVYMIRAYFDSKAEHKNLDNQIKDELLENLTNKVSNIFSEAGINMDAEEFVKSSIDKPTNTPNDFEEVESGLRIKNLSPSHKNKDTDNDNSVG